MDLLKFLRKSTITTQPAKLPEKYIERTLRDAPLNRTVYVVPWAVIVTMDNSCYLNADFDFHFQPCGTVSLPIKMISPGCFEITVSKNDIRQFHKITDDNLPAFLFYVTAIKVKENLNTSD